MISARLVKLLEPGKVIDEERLGEGESSTYSGEFCELGGLMRLTDAKLIIFFVNFMLRESYATGILCHASPIREARQRPFENFPYGTF